MISLLLYNLLGLLLLRWVVWPLGHFYLLMKINRWSAQSKENIIWALCIITSKENGNYWPFGHRQYITHINQAEGVHFKHCFFFCWLTFYSFCYLHRNIFVIVFTYLCNKEQFLQQWHKRWKQQPMMVQWWRHIWLILSLSLYWKCNALF